jgi:hypothetical protein
MISIYNLNDALREAVRNGHLNCLKYAHENGGDMMVLDNWASQYTFYGVQRIQLDCLKYAHENGHEDCVQYIKEHIT